MPGAVQPPWDAISLLADRPTALASDAFDHAAYAEVLAAVALSGTGAQTVGLFGPWGIGKSSILERLGEEVSGQCAFVIFDAWRYDGDTLRRHFVRELVQRLAARGWLADDFDVPARLIELEADRSTTKMRLRVSAAGLVPPLAAAAVVAAVLFAILQLGGAASAWFGSGSPSAPLISSVVALLVFAGNLVTQALRSEPEVTVRRRLEDPERFEQLFTDTVRALKPRRLVLAIDNLDRCSPQRAVELLRTIKTYLDPAVESLGRGSEAAPTVTFVLALDDDAMRRHLVIEAGADPASADARHWADEYLRKVFATSLRIVPLLQPDLRGYIAERVEACRAGLGVDTEQAAELVSLIHAALQTNPRRVLQFLNVLQLRMRLLRVRERGDGERGPRIDPPVTTAPLLIAKLALIEEEWPEHFAVLRRRPHAWREWHDLARAPSGEGDATVTPAPAGDQMAGEWATLAPFLRISQDIDAPSLRAFLRFNQARSELAVPGYEELRLAATTGGREIVGELTAQSPRMAEAYARALADLFAEELGERWGREASSVLEILLTEPGFEPLAAARAGALRTALDHPDHQAQLRHVPTRALLGAASGLDARRRGWVVDHAVALLGEEPERANRAATAIGEHVDWLSAEQRTRVARALAETGLSSRPTLLRGLLTAEPRLGSEALWDVVIRGLLDDPAALARPDGDDLVWLVGQAPAGERVESAIADVFDALLSRFPEDGQDELARRLIALGELAAASYTGPGPYPLITMSASRLTALPETARLAVAGWLWSHRGAAGDRAAFDGHVVGAVLEFPDSGVPWYAQRFAGVDEVAVRALEVALGEAQDPPDWLPIVKRLNPAAHARLVAHVAASVVGQGASPDKVRALLRDTGADPGAARSGQLADAIVRRAGESASWELRAGWLSLLASLGPADPGSERDATRLLAELAEVVDDPAQIDATLELAAHFTAVADLGPVEAVLERLLSHEVGLDSALDGDGVRSALEQAGEGLDPRARARVRRSLWMALLRGPADQWPAWRGRMALVPFITVAELDELASELVQAERSLLHTERRIAILALLRSFAPAHHRLVERLRELELGSDLDRSVAAAVRASTAPEGRRGQ